MQKTIDILTADGSCDTYISFPDGAENLPGILFYIDAIGLRDRIFDMVNKLASHGYYVIAPNVFYRQKRAPILDYGTLLKPEHRPELLKQVRAFASTLTPDMSKKDASSFISFLESQPEINSSKIAAVGYCMGGALALRAAGNYPDAFTSVATFHAANLATDQETSVHRQFKSIKAEIYIAHADQDSGMPPEQMERVKAELEKTGAKYKAELYEHCHHGWTMKDLPAYNKAGEERHWENLLNFFSRTLK